MDSVRLPSDLFTATFAASRSVGWSANVLEQIANNKLIRPITDWATKQESSSNEQTLIADVDLLGIGDYFSILHSPFFPLDI
jgi:hypothetical protein